MTDAEAAAGGSPVPAIKSLFSVLPSTGETPCLLASRCDACGELLFPVQSRCPRCSSNRLTELALSAFGELYTWTVVHGLRDHSGESKPYMVGVVELPEGIRVQGYIAKADPEDLFISMRMRLALLPLNRDDLAEDVVTYAFVPTENDS